jgi:DNA-binding CsgD family transcriptional regulator
MLNRTDRHIGSTLVRRPATARCAPSRPLTDAFTGPPIGRVAEIREIGAFLARSSVGLAGLLLVGAPGIGKTRLWRYGLKLAEQRGMQTLTARPAAADATFEFGGLADLLSDIHDEAIAALPRVQRDALEIALLRAAGAADGKRAARAVDEQVLAAGLLSLLRLLARERPIVVAGDDLQWRELPSARLRGLVVRRLERDRVAVLLAIRAEGAGGDRDSEAAALVLPELDPDLTTRRQLGSMSVAALHELIRTRTGLVLHRPTLVRIHEVSGGNPFYAIQLAQAFAAAGAQRLAGEALPVPHDLEELVGSRLDAVTSEAQGMLLYFAALPRPTAEGLARVVEDSERLDALLDEAVGAGIIEVDGVALRFGHPLLGTVHYLRASPSRRRAVHRRIAEATDDPGQRAYHLALAAAGPDAEVAADLDLAASRAKERGARDQALGLFEHALAATPEGDAGEIRRRTLAVAEAAFEAGDAGRARELLEGMRASLPAGPERAEVLLRLGVIAQTEDFEMSVDLLRAAERESGDDLRLRARVLSELARFPTWLVLGIDEVERVAREGVELAEQIGDPERLAHSLALLGSVRYRSGRGTPDDLMVRAVALEEAAGIVRVDEDGGPSIIYAEMLADADEPDRGRARLEHLCVLGRAERDPAVSYPLAILAELEFELGHWDRAEAVAVEALESSTVSGREATEVLARSALAMVRGGRGSVDEARELGTSALDLADRIGRGGRMPRGALGLLELSIGDAAAAWRWLEPAVARILPLGLLQPAPQVTDSAEALAALGRLEAAERLVDATEPNARRLGNGCAIAMTLRARAAVTAARENLAGAESLLVEAVSIGERVGRPLEHGRSLLALGSLRRRLQRKREAAEALGDALAIFEVLPAPVWAERARKEAGRIGGRSHSSSEEAGGRLSATERAIVNLVRVGQTNREVADALHLSPKTVEWNLTRIYRKLGVRSRTELAGRDRRSER